MVPPNWTVSMMFEPLSAKDCRIMVRVALSCAQMRGFQFLKPLVKLL